MLFLVDKQKIISYLIATSTVAVLFILSFFLVDTENQTIETSGNSTKITYQNQANTINEIIE